MMNARPTRSILATTMSRFLPAIAAVAVGFGGLRAYADTQSDLTTAINNIAISEEGKTTAPTSQVTATPDELVYAVYELSRTPNYSTPAQLASLVSTALSVQAGKVRADKDKVAPRLLNAVLQGSGILDGTNDEADVTTVLSALLNANSAGTTAQKLTVAGKTAVVAQALKSTAGTPSVGDEIATAALGAGVVTSVTDTNLKTFLTNALKGAGAAAGTVAADGAVSLDTASKTFAAKILTSATDKTTTAKLVAEAVAATNPNGAGAVAAANASLAADDAARESFATTLATDAKVAKALPYVINGIASSYTGSLDTFAQNVVTAAGTKATVTVRGGVAAGAIAALPANSALVDDVINKALTGKTLAAAEVITFAGAAVAGTGDNAAPAATELFNHLLTKDVTNTTNLSVALVKSIGATSPNSADDVIKNVITAAGASVFSSDLIIKTFAKTVAQKVTTSASAVGSAVAGAALKLADQSVTNVVDLGKTVIPTASKSALNIAQNLAALAQVTDAKAFAVSLVTAVNNSATAGAIAAGVAVTSVNGNNLNPAAGQTAGDIAAAVANINNVFQAKALTIAGAVAIAVNVEAVADIGGKVAALLQKTTPLGSKLPNQGQLGALATSLAKAINGKPAATSTNVTPTSNRVDELGELAAEMTRSAVLNLGVGATSADLAKAISAIGTSIMKSLSPTLVQNHGGAQADLRDAAGDIAGAIAQTLSIMNLSNVPGQTGQALSDANLTALLSTAGTTGSLYKNLFTGAKKESGQVTSAFSQVASLATGSNATLSSRLVTGSEELGIQNVDASVTGKFEIGSLVDPETPFKNLP